MYWETTVTLNHPAGYQGLTGRKARPLSLQLKPISITTYSNMTFTSLTPFTSTICDSLSSIPSPLSPRLSLRNHTIATSPVPQKAVININDLPTELLSLIFEEYLAPSAEEEDRDDIDFNSIPSVSTNFVSSPLRLTQVCRHWRATANAHRRLWSSIAVSIKPRASVEIAESSGRKLVRLLQLFLSRSKGTCLALSLASHTDQDSMSPDEEALAYAVFRKLLPTASRWGSVHFHLPSEALQRAIGKLMIQKKSSFESLRSVQMDLALYDEPCEDDRSGARLYQALLQKSPNLSRLVVDDDLLENLQASDDLVNAISWEALKTLEFECQTISPGQLLSICEKAVNLETLDVWRVTEDGESADKPSRPTPVSLASLRKLKITLGSRPQALLPFLRLPSVQTLQLALRSPGFSQQTKQHLPTFIDVMTSIDELLVSCRPNQVTSVSCTIDPKTLADQPQNFGSQQDCRRWCAENKLERLRDASSLSIHISKS